MVGYKSETNPRTCMNMAKPEHRGFLLWNIACVFEALVVLLEASSWLRAEATNQEKEVKRGSLPVYWADCIAARDPPPGQSFHRLLRRNRRPRQGHQA